MGDGLEICSGLIVGEGEGLETGFLAGDFGSLTSGDVIAFLCEVWEIVGTASGAACGRDAQELRQKPAAIAKKITPTLRIPDT